MNCTTKDQERIRNQLDRIVSHPLFRSSKRSVSFLRYISEKTLAGDSERIKEYSIAVDAFGLDSTFDQQMDPRVRVEAKRLRDRLKQYYEGPGCSDSIQITIPKGTYIPRFSCREEEKRVPSHALPEARETTAEIRIALMEDLLLTLPFPAEEEGKAGMPVLSLFYAELVSSLHDSLPPDCRLSGPAAPDGTYGETAGLRLQSRIHEEGDGILLYTFLTEYRSSILLWNRKYRIPMEKGNHYSGISRTAETAAGQILEFSRNLRRQNQR